MFGTIYRECGEGMEKLRGARQGLGAKIQGPIQGPLYCIIPKQRGKLGMLSGKLLN